MRRVFCLALLLASSAVGQDEVAVEHNVVYGKAGNVDLKLDLVTPSRKDDRRPALLLIHGGGWVGGDKKEFMTFCQEAAQHHGYVCATVEYRRAPRFVFPAQVEDVKCAVRWLRANADRLQIDTEKVGAMGLSAGGYLAMMLGVLDPADGMEGNAGDAGHSSKVQAVVSIFGPTTFISERPPVAGHAIVANFMGGTMYDRRDDYRRASPIQYVNIGDPPMLLFQGTKDSIVPFDQAVQMAKVLSDAKVPGRVEFLVGAGHRRGEHRDHITRASIEFFDAHLKP